MDELIETTELLTETLPVKGFVPFTGFTTAKKSVSWVAGAVFKKDDEDATLRQNLQIL